MMGIAGAVFKWTEDRFWRATPHGYFATLNAHRLANDPDYAKRQEFAEFQREVDPG